MGVCMCAHVRVTKHEMRENENCLFMSTYSKQFIVYNLLVLNGTQLFFKRNIFLTRWRSSVLEERTEQHFTNIRATYVWSGHNAKRIRVGLFSALGTGWGVA